jgi:hypothetical protein
MFKKDFRRFTGKKDLMSSTALTIIPHKIQKKKNSLKSTDELTPKQKLQKYMLQTLVRLPNRKHMKKPVSKLLLLVHLN